MIHCKQFSDNLRHSIESAINIINPDIDLELIDSSYKNDVSDSITSEEYKFQIFLPNTLEALHDPGNEEFGFFAYKSDIDGWECEPDNLNFDSIIKRIIQRIQWGS